MDKDQAIEFIENVGPFLRARALGNLLTDDERTQALAWYVQGIDLVTIGQNWGLTYEEIKAELNNVTR